MIKLITAIANAYIASLQLHRRLFIYAMEDEIQELADDGSPAAKLRIEILAKRIKLERQQLIRSSDSELD